MGWTIESGREKVQDLRIAMAKILGEPITRQLPREVTEECADVSRRMAQLSKEALDRIEDIEATARLSESKSGSIILR